MGFSVDTARDSFYTGFVSRCSTFPKGLWNRMQRFLINRQGPSPTSSITEFYREEFIKHHRCLQEQREYFSSQAIDNVESALVRVISQVDALSTKADADQVVAKLLARVRCRDPVVGLVRSAQGPLTAPRPLAQRRPARHRARRHRWRQRGARRVARAGAAGLRLLLSARRSTSSLPAKRRRTMAAALLADSAAARSDRPSPSARTGPGRLPPTRRLARGRHPLPDERSVAAGRARWRSPRPCDPRRDAC